FVRLLLTTRVHRRSARKARDSSPVGTTEPSRPCRSASVCTFHVSGITIGDDKFFSGAIEIHDPKSVRHIACLARPVFIYHDLLPAKRPQPKIGCRPKKH